MSKDVKPYTLEELAAEFKEGCVCPNPEQHAALAAPNKPDPIYCVRVSDWPRLRATVEALDEALADNAALLVELAKFLPAHPLLSQPHPGSALLERLKKAEEERDEMRREHAQRQAEWKQAQGVFMTAEARVKELEEALREMTPAPGFPKCDSRCSSNSHSYDEDNRCDCGMDEIRHRAEAARAVLSTPKVEP